jgi:hypothetical protein
VQIFGKLEVNDIEKVNVSVDDILPNNVEILPKEQAE